jgi:hypothetical protein
LATRRSQLDTKTSLDTALESSCRDLVEALDHVDAAVELSEAPELRSMVAVPCAAPGDCGSEGFEAPVELGELDVASGDLGFEVSDAVFDLTASSGTRASANRGESVEVLLGTGATPEGRVTMLLLVPALLGERIDLP